MKLTFVCNVISGQGGTETVLVKVLNMLSQNHNNKIKLVLSNKTPHTEWLSKINNKVKIEYPLSGSKLYRLIYFFRKFLHFTNNELVIVLSPNLIKYFCKLRKFIPKKCKIVSWFHFSIQGQDIYSPDNLGFADFHLAISTDIKKQLIGLGVDPQKVFLIFNPVDHRSELKLPKDQNHYHFLYVGRIQFNGQKNLQELLNAFALLDDESVLDMYGSGKDEIQCKKLCDHLQISDRVVWHGWVDNVWTNLQYMPTAIVLSSKFEGLPMVFLEAMSRGIPCVSANFYGFDDLIKPGVNGEYYHAHDIHELANKLKQVEDNHYSKANIQNSIINFYNNEYLKNLTKALEDIYQY